ncbi:lysophospholipase [Nocardia sp. NBC_01499]|uniref:alpha/beta fold hydrolase n=1 Tax=Nocardia sp. NBC_01499 TaxID=2903597 RepID=UPI00386D4151
MTDITLTLRDATLRATVTGTGPTVLLLHAGGERRGVWAPVAARMIKCGLRTVAYDLRGHGDSSGRATTLRAVAYDVLEMMRREPAPMVVVGASLGGLAAITALAEPFAAHRAAGLVLVDVVPDVDSHRVHSWLDDWGMRDRHENLVDDILASSHQLVAAAAGLELPILHVRGGRSPLDDADVNRLRKTNHRVTIASVPSAGHLVARDAPVELARIVSAHAIKWLGIDDISRATAPERGANPGAAAP